MARLFFSLPRKYGVKRLNFSTPLKAECHVFCRTVIEDDEIVLKVFARRNDFSDMDTN